MSATRSKLLIASGIVSVLVLLAGAAYAFELPPFTGRGVINAADTCATLGTRSRTAPALRAVVPDRTTYSFYDSVPDPRRDEMDHSFQSDCFVYGEGQQLLWAGAQMLEYDRPSGWIEEVVEQYDSASSLTPFPAGDKAVASPRVAAVYLPCTSHGLRRHLSVVVHLKQPGDADGTALRTHLIVLAKNAAVFAHRKARCDKGAVG
ncbi:hypothetical protein [Streptomyces torulosus]|uniref:hypothetical protein n=1 Tax=Streptomyces torulosus TaxID=68276 RepID=UPI0006EBD09E|nr:hypothetical protein [Streptomyces torulosus]